jgi:hypothetical protein
MIFKNLKPGSKFIFLCSVNDEGGATVLMKFEKPVDLVDTSRSDMHDVINHVPPRTAIDLKTGEAVVVGDNAEVILLN